MSVFTLTNLLLIGVQEGVPGIEDEPSANTSARMRRELAEQLGETMDENGNAALFDAIAGTHVREKMVQIWALQEQAGDIVPANVGYDMWERAIGLYDEIIQEIANAPTEALIEYMIEIE